MTTTSNKSKPKDSSIVRIEPLKCKNCGAPINPELTKCEYCGVSFVKKNKKKSAKPKQKKTQASDIDICPIRRLDDIDNPTLKDWMNAWYFVFTGKERA